MCRHQEATLLAVLSLSLAVAAHGATVTATPTASTRSRPPSATAAGASSQRSLRTKLSASPIEFVSTGEMLAELTALTAFGAGRLWRTPASQGESMALDWVAGRLATHRFLATLGMTAERESFRSFLGGDVWQVRLQLQIGASTSEVPVSALQGHRYTLESALRFDSDGAPNDALPDPVTVEGGVVIVSSAAQLQTLSRASVAGRIVFVAYSVVDRSTVGPDEAIDRASALLGLEPAGVVMVTQFSRAPGGSHGHGAGDLSAFTYVTDQPPVPTVFVRLEDLAAADLHDMASLSVIQSARLTWDADVYSPGTSGNLVATIPGADRSRAVILGAHIDSPNSPGAMDDGSGSVVLLEVARVLDRARVRPPVDIVLVWFGSEERGLYGSTSFASAHSELLDRASAMLQIDCLTRTVNGIDPYLNLVSWPFGRMGDPRLTWPDALADVGDRLGIWTNPVAYYGFESDSTSFAGFDVPHANLILADFPAMEAVGGFHYAGMVHNPYDTVELAAEEGAHLEAMARLAVAGALTAGLEDPVLRVTPNPDRRAVFVASHTEPPHMTPAAMVDLGMTLAWNGFDVDVVPYGRAVAGADLEDAALVIVLPVLDYPTPAAGVAAYDEFWDDAEVSALEAYVARGGLLVLTNSAHRLRFFNQVVEDNEDSSDANLVASRFGVSYRNHPLTAGQAERVVSHALTNGISSFELASGNALPFTLAQGLVLARVASQPAMALVSTSSGGEVLVLADLGMLSTARNSPANLRLWQNLAGYARSR